METITEFRYALGRAEEIINGSSELRFFDKPTGLIRELELKGRGDGLIIPYFIGVYQGREFVPITENEKEFCSSGIPDLLIEVLNAYFSSQTTQGSREIHPELISILYDSSIIDYNLARIAFGNSADRIAVTSVSDAPSFGDKDTALMSLAIDKLRGTEGDLSVARAREIIRPELELLREQGKVYGLTGKEFRFLRRMT
ncbi:MAG: hypothetical protein Q8P57_00600 [Candidatus Pacearchaeota archaeon]|nr:hypothetical protein [Candidatus Pacearchaeota archaeon]